MLLTEICAKPKNPFMYYSAFKLSIYFEREKSKAVPLHSIETKNTVPQIIYKKVNEIILDRRAGFHWCLEKAVQMNNIIHSAQLYSAYENDLCYGKFVKGKWFIHYEPQFTDDNMIVISKKFEVKNGFAILHDVEANLLSVK